MTLVDLLLRVRALLFRGRVEQDLDDEVDFHLAMAQRKHAASGHSADEATRLARLEFGRVSAVKEDCRTVRGTQLIETTLQDVRYAARGFRRSPAFVLTVAGTIAVGLGLNIALFTLFNAYVLRPVSVRDPYSLYSFRWTDGAGRGHAFSWDEYRDFEKEHPGFSEVAAVEYVYTRLNGRPFEGQLVTGNYFKMLDVGSVLGRTLLPEDAVAPGTDPVIVLSYDAWRNMFGGRPDIVGAKVMIRGYPMQVIGVARPEFHDLGETPRDFWAPLTMAARLQDGPDLFGADHPERLRIIGRLRHGESAAHAEAMLMAWSRQRTSQLPDDRKARTVLLQSKATAIPLTPELLFVFSPLAAAFLLVLVLACANVASMMLARGMARQREIGIRLSIGAARGRLVRQLLTESVLLAIPAAVLGLVVCRLAIEGSIWLMFATIPPDLVELVRPVTLPVDWRVVAFVSAAALASSLLFGLAPALQATRANVVAAARGEFTSDAKPVRVRNALVMGQIAVCTLLLVACGALVRTTFQMSAFDIGFRTGGLVAINIVDASRARVLAALASDPGVEEMAAASSVPLGGLVPSVNVAAQNGSAVAAPVNYVSPQYFGMLGVPVVRGRGFMAEEAASDAPVAILSAATAERLFPGENAVGQILQVAARPPRAVRVIGVVPDIVTCCIPYGKDPALLYLPATAAARGALLVRVRGDVEAERRRLDTRLGALAPGAVAGIHSLDQYHAVGIYPFRAASMIGLAVGALALLLTISGVYGVVAFSVAQRTKEIGIRVAVGATAGAVTRLVLRQSLRLAAIGSGLGVALAFALSRLLASEMLFLRVFDAAAFSGGVLLVISATLAAAYMPSRRAARIDPVHTLRYD